MGSEEQPKLGLRERKKMKTKDAIQQHAVRLFREQGYNATTVEQIAEAAEVSPSTFFRYFPTKESLVLEDDYDPLLIAAFQQQPEGLTPIQALREAMKQGFAMIPAEAREAVRERMDLAMSVPELRAASLNQVMTTMRMIAELVAARVGRDGEDFQVMTFAGAVIGAVMAVQAYAVTRPGSDYIGLIDKALAQLAAGLPLSGT